MNNFPFKYFVMVFFCTPSFSYNIWQLNTAMNNTGTGIVSIECQFGSIRGGRINLYRYSIRHIDSGWTRISYSVLLLMFLGNRFGVVHMTDLTANISTIGMCLWRVSSHTDQRLDGIYD